MKKTRKSIKFTIILAVLSLSIIFSSCQDPIFYGIMHDVAPEKATVSGNITTIARCLVGEEEYLFLNGNGQLMYKKLSSQKHGEWKSYSALPFKLHYYNYFPSSSTPEGHIGQQILRVISDKDNIYLLTASYETDNEYGIVLPKSFFLWTRPLAGILEGTANDWTDLAKDAGEAVFTTKRNKEEGSFETYFNLFFTNTPNPQNRHAYLRSTNPETSEDSYYPLNGAAPLAKTALDTTNYIATYSPEGENKAHTRINSAFYIGSTLYYSDAMVVCTNETKDTAATYACIAAADKDYNSTKDLKLFEGSGTSLTDILTAGSAIASLAVTADSVIIGEGSYNASYTSNGGIERIELDAETKKPKNETAKFTNNAEYQFTAAYIVMALLCADPAKTEADASIYATITYRGAGTSASASSSNIGLWSYYPDRGNWNRE